MIAKIDIFNFKAHRAVRIPLSEYQLFVGPNGTGKSTVFDALLLLSKGLTDDIESAVNASYAASLDELTHLGKGGAIGMSIAFRKQSWPILRYSVTFSQDATKGVIIDSEAVNMLRDGDGSDDVPGTDLPRQLAFDAFYSAEEQTMIDKIRSFSTRTVSKRWKRIMYKQVERGSDNYIRMRDSDGNGDDSSYHVQTHISGEKEFTLRYVPKSEGFEYVSWIKEVLLRSPMRVQLDIEEIRRSGSATKAATDLSSNGDNFANVSFRLASEQPKVFKAWKRHLLNFFPEYREVAVAVKPEDLRKQVSVITTNGTSIPHYLLSDGTLRFMCLTLLAFTSSSGRLLMIEEPENGLHPGAIEGVLSPFMQQLEDQQVIFASHSPVVLSQFKLADVLVFRKGDKGTETIPAEHHDSIKRWKGDVDYSSLLASGVF